MNKQLWQKKLKQNKVCCFDIDGVLFENNYPNYDKAQPLDDNIDKINELYSKGYLIILNTARGWITNEDWYKKTLYQLRYHGVNFHYLYTNKPAANYYIDDYNLSLDEFKNYKFPETSD